MEAPDGLGDDFRELLAGGAGWSMTTVLGAVPADEAWTWEYWAGTATDIAPEKLVRFWKL